jgi:outer membrane protein
LLVLLPAAVLAQTAAGKIGYVDLKRLLDNAPQMVDSRAKLQQEFAGRDSALKADESKLSGLQHAREVRGFSLMAACTRASAMPRSNRTLRDIGCSKIQLPSTTR